MRDGGTTAEATFDPKALREKPLPEACGFLSRSTLIEKVEGIRRLGLASSLRPDFLEQAAAYFGERA